MEKQANDAALAPPDKGALVSGASFAGLTTAYWLKRLGYEVTVVEIAKGLKKGGTPVNIGEKAKDILKRMGLLEQVQANRLKMEGIEFKNADDVTEGGMWQQVDAARADDDWEIERDTLLDIMFGCVKDDVEFVFNNSIAALDETPNNINVSFKDGSKRSFALVFGCDGNHSLVRKLQFGEEAEYTHFLGQYFSITIVDKLLIKENTTQMYNLPGKAVMLNAYNNKTDIILCFSSEKEISYDYRDEEQQRKIISEQFTGQGWRTPELLEEVSKSKTFYFDKINQIRMPSWTKSRVALVGDAAYCASPAAGMGGSLAIIGAGALADAFAKNHGNFELAFQDYNESFRPFIEDVQVKAVNNLDLLIPKTEEGILERNRNPDRMLR
ncbi:FAD-binding monooxygenase [Methylovirgula ligni]|uniref:2-polyprenyl-6-methoxyphenol hydroxylase-like FAD-dependent oxidoreductase n=1 Tax=Methylovirgula ligni TaxID=569860 RepID=A0A3D9Z1B4_9HYPH|nr:FAD-dependent monooxygenase [Methylovirgula ligni]QAY95673.1 FAD-binding monooxygenase [Methylovirgula ligni]REF88962.1 2-polyprenyl-6-methoxyphenol hydroxylase-like FAD-dependent oxidoreductase [Methylovirgula ligni]